MKHVLFLWLLGSVLLVGPVAAEASGSAADREQATVHFNAGNKAFARGDTHQAYNEYSTAWRLTRVFDIACNLGRAEAELGKLIAAAEHLEFCLENFSASPRTELRHARQRYAELFGTVKSQLTALNFRVEPSGATLVIDGVRVGTTPLGRNVYVQPGTHVIELGLPGYRDLVREVSTTAGESYELNWKLELLDESPSLVSPASPRAESDPLTNTGEPPHHISTRRLVLLGGAVLTVTGAGVGVGYYLQGRKLDDEARTMRGAIQDDLGPGNGVCAKSSHVACARLSDTVDRRETAWGVARIGLLATGVFGLGTAAAWLWWPDAETPPQAEDEAPRASAQVLPWVGGNQAGLVVLGSL